MPPYNPPVTHYTHLKIALDDKTMLKVIGKGGYHFKKITQQTNVNYIWWNKESSIIEIWGNPKNFKKAKQALKHRLDIFDDESDMPCYMKDFYMESNMNYNWVFLKDEYKQDILDKDIEAYMSKHTNT